MKTKPTETTTPDLQPHESELPRLGNRREILAIVVTLVIVAGGAFLVGFTSGRNVSPSAINPSMPPEFQVFWEVWNYVEDEFYYDTPFNQ